MVEVKVREHDGVDVLMMDAHQREALQQDVVRLIHAEAVTHLGVEKSPDSGFKENEPVRLTNE